MDITIDFRPCLNPAKDGFTAKYDRDYNDQGMIGFFSAKNEAYHINDLKLKFIEANGKRRYYIAGNCDDVFAFMCYDTILSAAKTAAAVVIKAGFAAYQAAKAERAAQKKAQQETEMLADLDVPLEDAEIVEEGELGPSI